MELKVHRIVNDEDLNLYLKYVESFDVINPFYKIWFSNVSEGSSDLLKYFTLVDATGKVLILMPIIFRKIPFSKNNQTYYDVISPYGYSGPLFNENMSRGYLIKFWELVDAWYKEHDVVSEFIRFSLNHNFHFYSGKLVPTLTNVNGAIKEADIQWQNFKQKVRNNYRKSAKENLKIQFLYQDLSRSDIKQFYDIYNQTMSRIGADQEYHYSMAYFENIIKLSGNNFMIAIVFKDGVAISTELILISGKTLYSFLGGTLSEYFNMRPNDFLKIEVLKWARAHHYEYYLLGGGRSDGDSLYQYKKSFFPDDKDLIFYTGRKIINKKMYKILEGLLNSNVVTEEGISVEAKKESRISFFPSYRKYAFNK
ncbi:GNAT family N-acetyltransferase [Mariniflexile litorale]|uniref:GNAT family N-acetyltransferase n=1 Tax=Mariniflexile litorale TaxID=3045158 RepID=A0AAU7EEW8_9FLAO|nr:GNAT family N-acetyltransferase [Mariniflexile sp. KMM 9835]MDQ8211528.1 GNAT family N-acetyltransferase [Mariniflexile sp. KMM 9835]